MDTPTTRRKSLRTTQPKCYVESSPTQLPAVQKAAGKSASKRIVSPDRTPDENCPIVSKTPKKDRNSTEFSPKKLRKNRTPSSKCIETTAVDSTPKSSSPSDDEKLKRRRSGRKSAQRIIYSAQPKPRKTLSKIDEKGNEKSEDSDNQEDISSIVAESTTLFDDQKDVEGSKFYALKTPKKKDSMALLVQRTPKTPRHNDPNKGTPMTPRNNRLSQIMTTPTSRPSASKCVKTPSHVRVATKRALQKVTNNESDEDQDFSADESEYEEDSESQSSSDSSQSDEEQEIESPPKATTVSSRVLKTPSVALSQAAGLRRSARNKTSDDYVLKPDDYFSNATAKSKTSNNTLDKLKNPRLPQDQLNKMLSNMTLSEEHESKIRELNESHKVNFDHWLILFDEGYTVLLHGLGSKRNLLINFHKEMLAKRHVIVINGFFPSLTIKSIIDAICVDLMEMTGVPANPHEAVTLLEKEMEEIPALRIFLIVHNLDGKMLRNDKAQSVLSRLANIKNIHMIASIDHINTPLLWNNTKLSNYNFVWFNCTSYLPYSDETVFENSLMKQNSGALELSSMKSVFQSLTNNARNIFILLVKHQLKNSGSPTYQGMPIKDLYSACREQFFASSDIALRAQLTEFFDHKLAKSKRTIDGTESITIPIKASLLEQFLNEQ